MNQIILFSPVGGTDPISLSNLHDGSLLHVCRVYQPTKVIMYMSYEVLKNQEKDDRYRYCLDRLSELQNRTMEYEIIERPDLKEVQEFDFFYKDFREIIESIFASMDETDTLLLNISSGTPAMKSGLLVLQTLGEFPCRVIQVATPVRKMNEHRHDDFDVEMMWELNEDNADDFKNRCTEVVCPTLSEIKKNEIIKKHVAVYDYQAALSVAETMSPENTKAYYELLQMAAARLLLDFKNVDKVLIKEKSYQLPVRESGSRKYFEYALNLNIKLLRHEYADFIRGITPLIVDLFEIVLKHHCRINVDDYCRMTGHGKVWDESRLAGTDVLRALVANSGYSEFRYGSVYSDALKVLIISFGSDLKLKTQVENLRSVEASVRNLAAHEIVSVTDETIVKLTGFTPLQIMNMIKSLFTYTGMNIKSEYWMSYDQMNQVILEKIG